MKETIQLGSVVDLILTQSQTQTPTTQHLLNEKYVFSEKHFYLYLLEYYRMEVAKRGFQIIEDENLILQMKKITKCFNKDNQNNKGIFIAGIPGNGKTTLLKALSKNIALFARLDYFSNNRLTMPIVSANDYKNLKNFKKATILAIDDVGIDSSELVNYGNVSNPLSEILEYRYEKQLFTIVTSNIPPSAIKKRYENRIADRFNEMFNVVIFKHDSFRHIEQLKLKEIKL